MISWDSVFLGVLLLPAMAFGATQFDVAVLPRLDGGGESIPSSVASSGVAGLSLSAGADGLSVGVPIVWGKGQVSALPIPGGYQGRAIAMNNPGDVVGVIGVSSPLSRPVLWHGGQLQFLDTVGMAAGSVTSINSGGAVAGELHDISSDGLNIEQRAVVWRYGQVTSITGFHRATAINDVGQLLVDSSSGQAIWTNGSVMPIPSLGGFTAGRALNDLGHVAGNAGTADGVSHVFLFADGDMTLLPDLPGDIGGSIVRAMNNADAIVGSGYNATEGIHAVLWEAGIPYDLNSLLAPGSGWRLLEAMNIDNDGRIVGVGQLEGQIQGFLLTPTTGASALVPEPGSLSLLAIASWPLVFRRRLPRR